MRPTRPLLLSTGMLMAALASGAVLCAADTEYTSIDQLPAAVQATLKQEAKGATLSKFEKEERDGVVTYTAEIPGTKAGTIVEFSVNAEGKLLKSDVEDISDVPAAVDAITTLGDLTAFRTLGVETLHLVEKKDAAGAVNRITDLESAWDKAENTLRAKNDKDWTTLDKAIDKALAQVRAKKPKEDGCVKALKAVIGLCPLPVGTGK